MDAVLIRHNVQAPVLSHIALHASSWALKALCSNDGDHVQLHSSTLLASPWHSVQLLFRTWVVSDCVPIEGDKTGRTRIVV